jgi:5'-nucleotidase/UDP-sugar diphosphatase
MRIIYNDQRLAELLDMAEFPILSGNIKPNEKSPLYGKLNEPYIINEINGEKVAVIGVVKIEKTKESSLVSDDVDFINEIEFVKSTVEEVKEQGINKIIVLSHLGYDFDQVLAAQTNDIDLIIGGDTHNLLDSSGEMRALGLPVTGEYPTVVTNADGKDTYVVQAWEYAKVLGKIEMQFDEQGEVIGMAGSPTAPIGGPYQVFKDNKWVDADESALTQIKKMISNSKVLAEGKPDPVIEEIITPYRESVKEQMESVIGSVKETLSNDRIPKPFTDIQNANGSFAAQIVADSFLYSLPHADLAIQNAGGVRANFLQGDYTMADAYTMLPFSNTVTTLKVTGEEVVRVLDEAIRYSQGITQSTGAFPYASHLRYDVYLNAADDVKSVYNVEVKDRTTGVWSPIDMKKTYVVATNSFTALGKDGYVTFEKAIQRDPSLKEEAHVQYAVPLVEFFTKQLKGGELAKPSADSYSIKSVKVWQAEQSKNTETESPTGEPAEKSANVTTYTVVKGDTLFKIAKRVFNDGMLWNQIYELNKNTIKNPSLIYPGQIIMMP